MYLAYKDTNILFKILPCILIATFLLMVITTSCFASSTSKEITSPDGQVGTITNSDVLAYDNIFILKATKFADVYLCNGGYFCIKIAVDGISGYRLRCLNSENEEVPFKSIHIGSSSNLSFDMIIERLNNVTTSDFGNHSGGLSISASNSNGWINSLLYTSHSVRSLNEDNTMGNEEVFQPAPQEGELVKATKSIDFLEVLQEILGILPIILLIVIGLLGLRKAINLIFQMLRKA